jgi:hypothetical protein
MGKARDFVFTHGALWERALYSYLFDDGSLDHVHQCLLCYKNADDGWGHGLEHDLKSPVSHPVALEYLLGVIRDFDLPVGDLLDGTPQWLEQQQAADGSLRNPDNLADYPIAPWWKEWGGQKQPDSIVGNLTKLGLVTPKLTETTRPWVKANHTLESIRANEWLFMAYHAFDYFMNVDGFPEERAATIENIVTCAEKAPEKQSYVLFRFAPKPDSVIAQAVSDAVIQRNLDSLQSSQRDDGGWSDEHDMLVWQPMVTIQVLYTLKQYGRL